MTVSCNCMLSDIIYTSLQPLLVWLWLNTLEYIEEDIDSVQERPPILSL